MHSMFVLILLLGIGCGVGGEVGTVAEVSQHAGLPGDPEDPGPCTGPTQFQAAQQIADAVCVSLVEDGNALCMAPIVARYCPDPTACQAQVCGAALDLLDACVHGASTSEECAALFPRSEVTRTLTLSAAAYAIDPATPIVRGVNPVSVRALGAANFEMPLPLEEGARITSISISHRGDGAADLTTYGVALTRSNGLTVGLGLGHVVDPGTSWASTPLDLVDTTIGRGDALTLHVGGIHVAPIELGNVTVTFARPFR